MSDDTSKAVIDRINRYIERHPYLSWLGLRVDSLESGTAHLSVPYRGEIANPGGPKGLHGGVSSAVLDAAGAVALSTNFDDPSTMIGQASVSTTDLNVSYLRPATDDLEIEAEVLYVGESTGVARMIGRSADEDGSIRPTVAGRGTYWMGR
jgi:uncharacterized protein (TIGR00369 family)